MKAYATRRAWERVEHALDRSFSPDCNPLRNLGAIASLMFAILLASGVYLYAAFDTSFAGAWHSIDALSREQPWSGGWLRSLHRYAADGFMLATLGHLLREWIMGHYARFRAMTWLTGIPLLVLMYVSGIGGFWLNWDTLGQYAAVASAELIDGLPLLGSAFSRNFLKATAVTDRLFSLLVFVHLGVPLLMLFGLWFHLQRITRPVIVPPRVLLSGLLATLGVLALGWPVMSGAPADPDRVPSALALDWIVLHLLPLADALSPGPTWILLGATLAMLLVLPLWRATPAQAIAVVDADNCNGCRRCVEDCPYSAITLESHPDGRPGKQIAVVAAERCASCGICAGACPSATPFRSASDLVNGIDMPQLPVDALRRTLMRALRNAVVPPVIAFGCRHGFDVASLQQEDVTGCDLLCIGQLPPSFIDYVLRAGAAGVVISGCAPGRCEFRLGNQWLGQRLRGEREPHLRASVPANRYRVIMAAASERALVVEAIDELRQSAARGIHP